jgi:alpha-mannosidase
VQEFVDVSGKDFGVTIAPVEPFALRLDLDPLTFEALGNDQNYKEVSQDQGGQGHFTFGYVLRAHAGDYREAEAYGWSRGVLQPLVATRGRLPAADRPQPRIAVDPARAIATCLKPADGEEPQGVILRLQEVGGKSGPVSIGVAGYRKAVETDLLERDLKPLPISDGRVQLDLKAHGLGAVRLVP